MRGRVSCVVRSRPRVRGRESDGDAVLAPAGCVRGDNEVVFRINWNDFPVSDPDATDALLWSRKIYDDAPRSRERGGQAQRTLNRLLPALWHGERQIVTNRGERRGALASQRFRDTSFDTIGDRTGSERHQQQ